MIWNILYSIAQVGFYVSLAVIIAYLIYIIIHDKGGNADER